jgi:hypothetical protein
MIDEINRIFDNDILRLFRRVCIEEFNKAVSRTSARPSTVSNWHFTGKLFEYSHYDDKSIGYKTCRIQLKAIDPIERKQQQMKPIECQCQHRVPIDVYLNDRDSSYVDNLQILIAITVDRFSCRS